MARTLPDKGLRRAAFLRALAEGETVPAACQRSRLKWSTLYAWRGQEPGFREAWDRAARLGADSPAARFEGALVERAVAGWDDPVFHAGELVGTRRRYSDPLLMFGIRELRERRRQSTPIDAQPGGNSKVTVIVEQLGPPTEAELAALEKVKPPKAVEVPRIRGHNTYLLSACGFGAVRRMAGQSGPLLWARPIRYCVRIIRLAEPQPAVDRPDGLRRGRRHHAARPLQPGRREDRRRIGIGGDLPDDLRFRRGCNTTPVDLGGVEISPGTLYDTHRALSCLQIDQVRVLSRPAPHFQRRMPADAPEIVVGRQQGEIVVDAELRQQRIDRADLDS
jgi:hypothetical protein